MCSSPLATGRARQDGRKNRMSRAHGKPCAFSTPAILNSGLKPRFLRRYGWERTAAFLRCLFRHESIEARWSDLTALFDSGQTLRQLASSAAPFIPITINTEAEKE